MQQSSGSNFNSRYLFAWLFIYKLVIEYIYIYGISPAFSYSGLTVNLNWEKYFISTLMLWLLVKVSPKNKEYPSSYMYLIIEVIILIPTLSYFWMADKSQTYMSYEIISAVLIAFILHFKRKIIFINEKAARISLELIFGIYILISVYLVIARGGIDSRAFSFETIYSLRAEDDISGFSGYLVNWCAKAFCPFFFVYYFYNKKKIYLIAILFLQVLLYLSFGNKAFLLSLGFLLLVLYVMKKSKNTVRTFIFFMAGSNILAFILDSLKITTVLRDVIPYRLIFVPAQGQFQYYEFFSIYKKLHFSEGILGKLFSIQYPYDYPIGIIVNRYFYGPNHFSNGNTGIFSYAFADAGLLGMIMMALIVGLLFWIIDSSTSRIPVYGSVCALSYACVVLNDTGLLISLWTGGVLITTLLLMVFNSTINKTKVINNSIRDKLG